MATIVTSGCNSLTREEVIEQIQEVLKAYENRIREIRHDTDRLVPEGKDIVDSYCCNEEDEQVLVQKAYSDKAFFEQMPDEQVMQYHQVCRELNKILELGVEGLVAVEVVEAENMTCTHSYDGAIDVAKYIVEEIKKNIKSTEALEIHDYMHYEKYLEKNYNVNGFAPPPDPLTIKAIGLAKWIEMVDTGHPWDHKWQIKMQYKYCAVARPLKSKKPSESFYHKYKQYDFFYDVWSNIHYGFLGRFCGISEELLHFGSGIQQFAFNLRNLKFSGDDEADKITMQLGMDLYSKYKDNINELNYQVVLDELEKLSGVGNARLLHYCFDSSSERFTPR